jgi:hypothetical protein
MQYRPLVGSQFEICDGCGALVVEDSKATHDDFHNSLRLPDLVQPHERTPKPGGRFGELEKVELERSRARFTVSGPGSGGGPDAGKGVSEAQDQPPQ